MFSPAQIGVLVSCGDEFVGIDVFRRHGLLQPHQIQRLHAFGHLLPGRKVVAGVHVGADVDVGPHGLPRRGQLIDHALDFRRAGRPVELVVLVGIVPLVQIELHRGVAVLCSLGRAFGEISGVGSFA